MVESGVGGGDRLDMEDVAQRLRELAYGAAQRGEPLPGEPTLVATLGISRPTLREIMARLECEGLIRRRQGAMTIANPGAAEIVSRFDEQVGRAELLRRAGFEPDVDVIECAPIRLSPIEAQALLLHKGAPAVRVVKRWTADGEPALLSVDVVPISEPSAIDIAAIDPRDSLAALVDLVRGDVIEWELAWPGAELSSTNVRSWLGLGRRRALLTLELVGVGRSGQRCYHATEYHVPGVARSGLIRRIAD